MEVVSHLQGWQALLIQVNRSQFGKFQFSFQVFSRNLLGHGDGVISSTLLTEDIMEGQ